MVWIDRLLETRAPSPCPARAGLYLPARLLRFSGTRRPIMGGGEARPADEMREREGEILSSTRPPCRVCVR